jgi:hypothetical protein
MISLTPFGIIREILRGNSNGGNRVKAWHYVQLSADLSTIADHAFNRFVGIKLNTPRHLENRNTTVTLVEMNDGLLTV